MANRVVISICGEEYTFVADESASYMQKVGNYVGEKMSEVLNSAKLADSPYTCSRIRLKDGASVREGIATANEAVELRSFKEVIPSMNDIFIRAVEGTL